MVDDQTLEEFAQRYADASGEPRSGSGCVLLRAGRHYLDQRRPADIDSRCCERLHLGVSGYSGVHGKRCPKRRDGGVPLDIHRHQHRA